MRALVGVKRYGAMAFGVAGLLGGCSSDPCDNIKGACISATIKGTAKGMNRLLIGFDGDPAQQTPASPGGTFGLPVKVAIVPPANSTGAHDIHLTAFDDSTFIAADTESVDLPASGRVSHTFTLDANGSLGDGGPIGGDGGGDGGDGGSSPVSLAITGSTSGIELEPMTLTLTVTAPAGSTPTISVDETATVGAMLTQPSGSTPGTWSWTPRYNDAGSYTLQFSISDGQGHTGMSTVQLTVANGADPAPPLYSGDVSSSALPVNIIGDFDGDSYADLAQCSITVAGGSATYVISLLYGDKSGLPTTVSLPPGRLQTYTFAGGSTGGASTPRARCVGADVDHDGKSDILFSDPNATGSPAGSGTGQIWIFYGQDRINTTITPEPAMSVPNGQVLGANPVFVGDYNGDGNIDFATQVYSTTTDTIYVFPGTNMMRPAGNAYVGPAGSQTLLATLTGNSSPCGQTVLQGFGDVDHDGKAELLMSNPNFGASSSSDCPNVGGVSLIFQDSTKDLSWVRPSGSDVSWAQGLGSAILCDVDNDQKADLVAVDAVSGTAGIFYAPLTSALPAAETVTSTNGKYGNGLPIACAPKMFGNDSLLLAALSTSSVTSVDVVSTGHPPLVEAGLPTPQNAMSGQSIGSTGDVNGDGKTDLLVGAPAGKYWVVYGR